MEVVNLYILKLFHKGIHLYFSMLKACMRVLKALETHSEQIAPHWLLSNLLQSAQQEGGGYLWLSVMTGCMLSEHFIAISPRAI